MKKLGPTLKKAEPSLIRILQIRFLKMIEYLKKGKSDTQKNQEETEVRNKVEDILKELKKAAIRLF